MRRILFLFAFFLAFSVRGWAAIAYEGGASGNVGSGTLSYAYTTHGTANRVLVCSITYYQASGFNGVVNTVTWNGQSFTKASVSLPNNVGATYAVDVWYLVAPAASTASNVTITSNITSGVITSAMAEYSGAAQGFSGAGASVRASGTYTISLSSTLDNSILYDTFVSDFISGMTLDASLTLRVAQADTPGIKIGDATLATAGTYSTSDTYFTSAAAGRIAYIIEPFTGATPTPTYTPSPNYSPTPTATPTASPVLTYTPNPTLTPLLTPSQAHPPMGFAIAGSNAAIRAGVDSAISTGLLAKGWNYFHIDNTWADYRSGVTGQIVPFSQYADMSYTAAYVQAAGGKFSLYYDAGTQFCGAAGTGVGSLNNEVVDVNNAASAWHVDDMAIDDCYMGQYNPITQYTIFGNAIAQSTRPGMTMTVWGSSTMTKPWLWAASKGASTEWATLGDVDTTWAQVVNLWSQVLDYAGTTNLTQYSGPPPKAWIMAGGLQIGRGGGHSLDQSQFNMWSIAHFVMYLQLPASSLDAPSLATVGNQEVIAVNQDPIADPCVYTAAGGGIVYRTKISGGNKFAFLPLNPSASPLTITATWTDFGLPAGTTGTVRNLVTGTNMGDYVDSFSSYAAGQSAVNLYSVDFNGPASDRRRRR